MGEWGFSDGWGLRTEMDEILHGCSAMGEQAFKLSVTLLEKILEESTALFPDQVSWCDDAILPP
jgi:hypothetical protein